MPRSNEEFVVWMWRSRICEMFSHWQFCSRVTFRSQQSRAFNLVHALFLRRHACKVEVESRLWGPAWRGCLPPLQH